MRKRILSMILAVFMVVGLLPSVALPAMAVGGNWADLASSAVEGTDYTFSGNNYLVKTEIGLAWVAAQTNNDSTWSYQKTISLEKNLNLSGRNWTPIGLPRYSTHKFRGTFNGEGKTIEGLTINNTETHTALGLFGWAENATIINVGVTNVNINVQRDSTNAGAIRVGALAGGIKNTTVKNCYSTGAIAACSNGIFSTDHSRNVSLNIEAGGLIGYITGCKNLMNSYSLCDVKGITNATRAGETYASSALYTIGGFVGSFNFSDISNCYAKGNVEGGTATDNLGGQNVGVGGFFGYTQGENNFGEIAAFSCYWLKSANQIIANKVRAINENIYNGYGWFHQTKNNISFTGTDLLEIPAAIDKETQNLYTGTSLVDALNAWVSATASTELYTWKVVGGYPVLDAPWILPTFAVTYNPGVGCTGSQQTATKTGGTALTLKNAIFTRVGYDQTGWATSDGGTKAYDLGGSYTTEAAQNFYPAWTLKDATVSLTGSDPSAVTFGYTTAPSMKVGISNKDDTNFTYTYAWYEGNTATGTAIATSETYTAPTELAAGTHNYSVRVTATNKADNSKTAFSDKTFAVTVNKASGSGSVAMAGWTYGGSEANPAPTSTTNGTGAVSYTYAGRNGTTYANSATKPTNAGDYTVTATFAASGNYVQCTATADFTIAKAPVTFVVTNNNLEYNASARSATVAQTDSEALKIPGGGYAVSYAQGGVAVASPTNKGNYDVVVTISDPNFKHASTADAASKVGTLTINGTTYPQAASMTWPTAANLTYGQKLGDSALTDGDQTASGSYTWKDGSTMPTVANNGYTVVFTPSDSNYTPVEHTVLITVSKATPTLSLPTAANIIYGQTLSASAFIGGSASTTYNGNSGTNVPGAFTWAAPDTMPAVSDSGATEYDLIFTPTDSGNYNIVTTGKIRMTVEPKEVGLMWTGHESLIYSGNPVNVTAEAIGMVGKDVCTVTVTGGDKTDAGNHTVTATALSNSSYKLPTADTRSYTIAKAPVTFAVTDKTHTYNAANKAAIVAQAETDVLKMPANSFTVSYQQSAHTLAPEDAGDYDVMVTIKDNNFKHKDSSEDAFKVGTLTIEKKPITALWKNLHHVYDGTTKAVTFAFTGVETDDKNQVSAQLSSESSKTDSGSYTVAAELTGSRASNYTLTNPTGTLVIQKAPVIFTVSGNMVKHDGSAKTATVTATANNVPFTDFTVTYQKDNKAVETPNDIANYDIYAKFTNTNYRHVDGADGTARKIGVLNIFKDTAPATYTLSFAPGEGGSGSMASLTAAQSGTAHALPACTFTKSNSAFAGWQYNGKTYQPGQVLEQPASNITLTALWSKGTYAISGVVDQNGNPAVDAVVTLMLGSRQMAETVTDITSKYSFADVAPGLYNLVVSKNGVTQTVKVEIIASNAEGQNITLPVGKTNSVVSVASGTPAIVVGNLEKTFDTVGTVFTTEDKTTVTNGGAVEIKFAAQVKAKDAANADQTTIAAKASGTTVELYLDMTLSKTVTPNGEMATTTTIPVSDVLLESVIPLPAALQGKQIYTVYRLHAGNVDTLTTTPNANGEYISVSSDKTTLTLNTKNFSTYAIAWTTRSGDGGGSAGVSSFPINLDTAGITGGSIKGDKSNAALGTKVTITVTPNAGYKLTKLGITDKDGKAVTYQDHGDGTYSFLMPSGKVNVTPTFEKTDNTFPFVDVTEGHWARKAIEWAYGKNLFAGTSKTTFAPNASTTRGMIITTLFRMEGSPAGFEKTTFSDVAADSYCASAVGWGSKQGIIKGYSNEKYGPEDNITREQLATILYRYAEFKNYNLNKTTSLDKFSDGKQVTEYAKQSMSWAVANDLFSGKGNGILDPTGKATRAEVATILMRFDVKFEKKA